MTTLEAAAEYARAKARFLKADEELASAKRALFAAENEHCETKHAVEKALLLMQRAAEDDPRWK